VPLILHVDMDAFFAAVEQRDNPSLKGRPVVVCGGLGPRSVVSAASYEARRFGVHAAMPVTEARRRCPEAVFLVARHRHYAQVSRRLRSVLEEFAPDVEQTSIDEAYLNATGCDHLWGGPVGMAKALKQRVRAELGLTCSVGIAQNRFLAKMASSLCKPDGLLHLESHRVPELLWPLAVRRLCGVGQKTAERLERLGLRTVGDAARADPGWLEAALGTWGRWLWERAHGRDPVTGRREKPTERSLSHEVTFACDVSDPEAIRATLLGLCDRLARRLRKAKAAARTVFVKLRFADFHTITRSRTLGHAVVMTEDIFHVAWDLVRQGWAARRPLRLIGVGVSGLLESGWQISWLDDERQRAKERLALATDLLRDRFGEDAVERAAVLLVRGHEDGRR